MGEAKHRLALTTNPVSARQREFSVGTVALQACQEIGCLLSPPSHSHCEGQQVHRMSMLPMRNEVVWISGAIRHDLHQAADWPFRRWQYDQGVDICRQGAAVTHPSPEHKSDSPYKLACSTLWIDLVGFPSSSSTFPSSLSRKVATLILLEQMIVPPASLAA